ncbi:MAG: PLP-dependent aminotransferase family protein [Halorhodospira halophila]|uniref:aminotransferase-like domain-containing protein n=1 Tax=Halorhodospira TaxID=85108 RepID=UPI001912CD25|nr:MULTISPECIES: PLP-dependent aminotransferase family protein [Halorhodospira]MBK5937420.1 GntR family transcriptional regulator [Halorhodospira halophila]MCC3751228.1 PLP-dependent aminotransferase family protein [Halorhodospira halophila]MCG5537968.1 PLP-dependent aminotransferase family protein [Halorhodospira sp. 9622]MCG5540887.1 PLP-dependent aminotransferase family protein [Halorhodospira sp. M39old]MCG5546627.1 PLP-dependent aminotransferase family protein [Halorhodospira sp. M38]
MTTPLYERVAETLAGQIEQGVYAPGDRLPGLRRLRRHFGVSMATIVAACELLEQREILEARPRSGFYVRERTTAAAAPSEQVGEVDAPSLVLGQERVLDLVRAHHEPDVVSLGAAAAPAAFLPAAAMDRSFARVRRRQRERVNAYDFPPGCAELRTQIARRMAYAGCSLSPDDIVLTAGCQEAITLSLRAVAEPGDVVAIESPTFYGILQAIESQGMQALEVATDPHSGMIPEALERALSRWSIRACVLMPTFGNPLGHVTPEARKQELVTLLNAHNVPLIEDDVYGELAFDGTRPWAAKAFDGQGEVLYCSSFSKILGAGLRVGWVAPGRYRDRLVYLKYATSQATCTLSTLAVADYLEQGGYDRFLRRARRNYERHVRWVAGLVRRHFPEGTRVTRPRGGFVVWVELPAGCDSLELQRRALAEGVSVAPGPVFSPTGRYGRCLRLNCAQADVAATEWALQRLGALAAGEDRGDVRG